MKPLKNLLPPLPEKTCTAEEKSTTTEPPDKRLLFLDAANRMLHGQPTWQPGTEYAIDDENRQAVTQLYQYFTCSPKFKGAPGKGLLLMGNVGSGKTFLMQVWQGIALPGLSFRTVSSKKVAETYALEGFEGLKKYELNYRENGMKNNWCFDDLGLEQNRKYYGTEANVMAELIDARYPGFLQHGTLSHFTTNLTPQEIENHYGDRILSRLRHMCNFIILGTGESVDRRR